MPRFLATLVALAILSTGGAISHYFDDHRVKYSRENLQQEQEQEQRKKIHVDVYYEQLCPASVFFVTRQLVPAYEQLKDYVIINFVPFGKASYEKGHPTKFTCQHGPLECEGNKRQACALYEIQQSVRPQEQQRVSTDIIGCVMSFNEDPAAIEKCAKKSGFSNRAIENIYNCSQSDLGNDLLISCGKKTEAFESPLLSVPTIALNGVKNKKAREDFIGEICFLITDADKPTVCADLQMKKLADKGNRYGMC